MQSSVESYILGSGRKTVQFNTLAAGGSAAPRGSQRVKLKFEDAFYRTLYWTIRMKCTYG